VADDFDAFYAASYHRVLKQLVLVRGDLAGSEDVVQEAFARASVRWERLRRYELPEAWVRRVALNLAAQAARRLRRQARALLRLSPPPAVAELEAAEVDLANALRALSLGQRQVVVLHYLAGARRRGGRAARGARRDGEVPPGAGPAGARAPAGARERGGRDRWMSCSSSSPAGWSGCRSG
jgi:Sigma-70 region 2